MFKSMGIIGGMGSLATVDLFHKIVTYTDAANDSEHIHIYIDNNTLIPDRSSAILRGGADPRKELIRSALKLETMGADFLIMPCNTAHYYYDDILPFISIPFLHIAEETAKEIRSAKLKKIGLLATDATISAGIYDKVLRKYGIDMLFPSPEGQKQIMSLIFDGVKAYNQHFNTVEVLAVIEDLQRQGAETLVLACTELPIAFEMYGIRCDMLDPTKALALSAIRFAGKKVAPRE